MKLYTSISARYIHFKFFFFTSVCKIAATPNNFRTIPMWTGSHTMCRLLSLFWDTFRPDINMKRQIYLLFPIQADSVLLFPLLPSIQLPIFGTPFLHIDNLQR